VWTGAVLGIVLKYHSCLLTVMSISCLYFLYVQSILEKLYYLWTKSKVLFIIYTVLHIWVLLLISLLQNMDTYYLRIIYRESKHVEFIVP